VHPDQKSSSCTQQQRARATPGRPDRTAPCAERRNRAPRSRFVFLFTGGGMHRDCSTRVHGGGGVTPTQTPYPPSGARTQLATNQLHAAGGVRWTNRDLVFICLCCCWRLYYMESKRVLNFGFGEIKANGVCSIPLLRHARDTTGCVV